MVKVSEHHERGTDGSRSVQKGVTGVANRAVREVWRLLNLNRLSSIDEAILSLKNGVAVLTPTELRVDLVLLVNLGLREGEVRRGGFYCTLVSGFRVLSASVLVFRPIFGPLV